MLLITTVKAAGLSYSAVLFLLTWTLRIFNTSSSGLVKTFKVCKNRWRNVHYMWRSEK